jgi:hypothetical protein
MTASVMPKIVWISKDAFLSISNVDSVWDSDQLEGWQCVGATFTAANGETRCIDLTKRAGSSTLSDEESSIFWRMVMTSNCWKLLLLSDGHGFGVCSAPVLSDFLVGNLWLHDLQFREFVFEEDHCRALATLERSDLKICFTVCTIDARDAEDAFIEWLRHSQVVTALINCEMESCIFSALHGNSSIKYLNCRTKCDGDEQCEDHLRSLAQALPGNQGLDMLDVSNLTNNPVSDETWNLLFRSLWTHPRIESMRLDHYPFARTLSSAESKTSMMNAVLQMVRSNTVAREIDLPDGLNDEDFYQNHILPRLEMNRSSFEEQRVALKEQILPFVARFSDEHCTSCDTTQIYSFGFSRKMSLLLFERRRRRMFLSFLWSKILSLSRILSLFLGKSERRKLDAALVSIWFLTPFSAGPAEKLRIRIK